MNNFDDALKRFEAEGAVQLPVPMEHQGSPAVLKRHGNDYMKLA